MSDYQPIDPSTLPEKYPPALRMLHWAMALCFLALFINGFIMVDLDKEDPLRPTLFALHKSVGVLTIGLLAARLAVRLRSVLPALASGLQPLERQLMHWAHRGLYLLMLITPFLGWAHSDLHGRGVRLFGLPMPKLFPTLEDIGRWPGEVHSYLAYGLLALVVLHVVGVLKHRFIDRACVLKRML